MKKIKINSELALLFALILLSFGMVLIIKANIGITVVQAPVYVLSVAIPQLSIGTWTYIVQGILFIIMLLVVKRFKISYIISFITGFIYGFILDFFMWLMKDITADSIIMVIIFYVSSFFIFCIAIAIFFTCKAPLMPYDIFLREVVEVKGYNLKKAKWIYDLSCILIAISLSFILTKKIIGIGIGTIIFALFISPIMSKIIKFIDKYFVFVPFIKDKYLYIKK